MIFKNAVFDAEYTPALSGFPLMPGLPEYTVYSHAASELARYLPEVYLSSEVVHGQHYQYLLEDLENRYEKKLTHQAILAAAQELPILHETMKVWSFDLGEEQLLQYDHVIPADLLDYVQNNLENYVQRTALPIGQKLLSLWPKLAELFKCQDIPTYAISSPIHGDFTTSNILFHKRMNTRIKVTNWEWAGIGIPHADLATLLKAVPSDIEQQAVKLYADIEDQLPLYEHQRLYQFCKLERGLVDAGLIAAQKMYSTAKATFNLEYFIEHGLRRAFDAFQELDTLLYT
jgi:hypothetical protein